MKKTFATLVALSALCASLGAQVALKADLEKCNTLRLSVSLPGLKAEASQYFVYWIERQIAPGIWTLQEKKIGRSPSVVFESVPTGVYRACGMIEKTDAFAPVAEGQALGEKLLTEVVQVRVCGNELASRSKEGGLEVEAISLYPNPARDVLHFFVGKGDVGPDTWLELLDVTGRRMERVQLTDLAQSIDVHHLPTGIYTATILRDGLQIFHKQVVISNQH